MTSDIWEDHMGVDVNLEGIGDLVDTLELTVANATGAENEALQAAAQPILNEAKETTAFHDHNKDRAKGLRASLKISKPKSDRTYKYKYIQVLTAAPHAHLVEFGHSGDSAPPHPFLAPAFEHHETEAYEIIRRKLSEALK